MKAGRGYGPFLPLALGLLLFVACGGDSEDRPAPATLSDPRSVPTATPWSNPPEPIILDETALTPVPDDGEEDGDGDVGPDVTPVQPFQITSEESTNLRSGPSTQDAVVGTLDAGQEATVVGQVQGEAVDGSNDIWYQTEDRAFVYSGAVTRVEE